MTMTTTAQSRGLTKDRIEEITSESLDTLSLTSFSSYDHHLTNYMIICGFVYFPPIPLACNFCERRDGITSIQKCLAYSKN